MIFMALAGRDRHHGRPHSRRAAFLAVETTWGGQGVLYLIGLGAIAMLFALFLPRGA